MREDQLVALVSVLLALVLAVMRLRGELAARRDHPKRKQHNQMQSDVDDFERLR